MRERGKKIVVKCIFTLINICVYQTVLVTVHLISMYSSIIGDCASSLVIINPTMNILAQANISLNILDLQ